jgi:hypothetical protein
MVFIKQKISIKILVFCIAILTGCLTSKKVDRQEAKQYTDIPEPNKNKPEDVIAISTTLTSVNKISETVTKTSKMLPLLVYWQWHYDNTCTFNPQIPISNFSSTVLSQVNKGLKQKLNGQKLELSVDEIPNKFAINDKAHLIFAIYAFAWDNVTIKTLNSNLVVSYRIIKENTVTKKETITIPYADDRQALGMFKFWKNAVEEYLDTYDANIAAMSKLFVEQLLKDL